MAVGAPAAGLSPRIGAQPSRSHEARDTGARRTPGETRIHMAGPQPKPGPVTVASSANALGVRPYGFARAHPRMLAPGRDRVPTEAGTRRCSLWSPAPVESSAKRVSARRSRVTNAKR